MIEEGFEWHYHQNLIIKHSCLQMKEAMRNQEVPASCKWKMGGGWISKEIPKRRANVSLLWFHGWWSLWDLYKHPATTYQKCPRSTNPALLAPRTSGTWASTEMQTKQNSKEKHSHMIKWIRECFGRMNVKKHENVWESVTHAKEI